MLVEGSISVKAALLGGKRKVERVFLDARRNDKEAYFITCRANEAGIPVEKKARAELDAMASGRTHGGVLCSVSARRYEDAAVLFSAEVPFLAVLEGAEDPYNLGYVIRALYSGGCTGLIIPERSWEAAEPVILKSSAGAFDYLPIVQSSEVAALIEEASQRGIHTFAAMRRDAIPCYEADFRGPVLIAIGGEMRGLSASVLAACSTNIYIPYANDFRNALNAAGAAAVLGFEVNRQRNFAPK
ncbi:MAG: RNA methyltransferase [Solobacterium sp.]|nr:RNA methyltransferase [Solobacterium sp.]